MDGEGVTITTAQIIALLASAGGIIGTLLRIIQRQYDKHYTEMRDEFVKRFDAMELSHKVQVEEIRAGHTRAIDQLNERVTWLEERDAAWRDQQQNYISTLERLVDVQHQQTDAMTAVAEKLTVPRPVARPTIRPRTNQR